jgi:Helix-turn-helix domain
MTQGLGPGYRTRRHAPRGDRQRRIATTHTLGGGDLRARAAQNDHPTRLRPAPADARHDHPNAISWNRSVGTVASLPAELGVSQKTIRCAIARRELPAVKRGSRWIISADART